MIIQFAREIRYYHSGLINQYIKFNYDQYHKDILDNYNYIQSDCNIHAFIKDLEHNKKSNHLTNDFINLIKDQKIIVNSTSTFIDKPFNNKKKHVLCFEELDIDKFKNDKHGGYPIDHNIFANDISKLNIHPNNDKLCDKLIK